MITEINIISGFLGAGKTTFLKKIIPHIEGKAAIIENEFGDTGIDGDVIGNGVPLREISAGCICCSVADDLRSTIKELVYEYGPDHIFIEPSGVGALSEIIKVCRNMSETGDFIINISRIITIVDAEAFEDCLESFGSFYQDQIKSAHIIFLSHISGLSIHEIDSITCKLELINPYAVIYKDDWNAMNGDQILGIVDSCNALKYPDSDHLNLLSAEQMFSTFCVQNPKVHSECELGNIPGFLKDKSNGEIYRVKGIVTLNDCRLIHFNFTPYDFSWEYLEEESEPRIVIIGKNLNVTNIANYFSLRKMEGLL